MIKNKIIHVFCHICGAAVQADDALCCEEQIIISYFPKFFKFLKLL